ncbi:MAG: hypothetical protein AB8G23_07805 [Myxococcota bacterium]
MRDFFSQNRRSPVLTAAALFFAASAVQAADIIEIEAAAQSNKAEIQSALKDAKSKLRLQLGTDLNSANNPLVQPGDCESQRDGSIVCQDPAIAGNGRDQSLQFGDILQGGKKDDLQIGLAGSDVLIAGSGNDIMLGGLEHFGPQNRDRAFGGSGSDIFIWKPGDGSDFFQGGKGTDAVIFGVVGEPDGDGAAFGVVTDGQAAIPFISPETGLPEVNVSGSPGFCSVIDDSTSGQSANELDDLEIDHLVRFTIRPLADAFEAGLRDDDNGLRVTLHLDDVEYVVCTAREGGEIEVLDLRYSPARQVSIDDIKSKTLRKRIDAMVF